VTGNLKTRMRNSLWLALVTLAVMTLAACGRTSPPFGQFHAVRDSGTSAGRDGADFGSGAGDTLATVKAKIRSGEDLSSPTLRHGLVVVAGFARDRELLDLLRARGVSIDEQDPDHGTTPLQDLVLDGNASGVKFLIEQGAAIDAMDAQGGRTALFLAIDPDRLGMIRLLLAHGANPNATDSEIGMAPLHVAASEGLPQIVGLLLEGGASPNIRDHFGVTPLHLAAQNNQMKVAEMLLARGADINARSQSGKTPLTAALQQNRMEMAAFLRAKGGVE
jgi:ankyrin repeat protein